MPCEDRGSTATSVELGAYVPDLNVRQPATKRVQSLLDPYLTKLLSDEIKCIMNMLVCTCMGPPLLVQYRTTMINKNIG